MELILKLLPAALVVIGLIGIGIRIEKANRQLMGKHQCDIRYVPLWNKTTFVQVLLMEMATEEQKERAKSNFTAFDLEKEINGTKT